MRTAKPMVLNPGDVIHYWRSRGPRRRREFVGPARLLGEDVHDAWVIHRGTAVLADRRQLRPSTTTEREAWSLVQEALLGPLHRQSLGQRGYLDIRQEWSPARRGGRTCARKLLQACHSFCVACAADSSWMLCRVATLLLWLRSSITASSCIGPESAELKYASDRRDQISEQRTEATQRKVMYIDELAQRETMCRDETSAPDLN